MEESKYPQEYTSDSPIKTIVDNLNENKKSIPRGQAKFKRSRHSKISHSIIRQNYYELTKET